MPIQIKTKVIQGIQDSPHLLITGGVHGDEFEPMAAIRRLMKVLDPHQLQGTVTLAPVVNEAAFRCSSRTAEDGLDLARVFPGSTDGTITERTAWAVAKLITGCDYYIDLHTGGTTMSAWPFAGYMLHCDDQILVVHRAMAKAFNLPLVWGTSPHLEGRSISVARDAGVPAIYCEYQGRATLDASGVDAYRDGCLNVMAELGMIERCRPPSKLQWFVEDDRENSGHLQLQNRSPMEGFFEPAVELGNHIKKGAPIGTICDVLGETVHTVCSQQDGIVIVLKTFCRVNKGDSVGVVMEVDRPSKS